MTEGHNTLSVCASIVRMKDTVGDKQANELAERMFHVDCPGAWQRYAGPDCRRLLGSQT